MRTGPLLASDLVDRYQPLGAFGQPVYLSWVQLRATIAQTLGPRHADYFARPDRDPNNLTLHWISEVPGAARRWADLSAEEQARVALDLHALRSDFLRYVADLRGQSGASAEGKGAAAFASLLEQAMLVPDDSHLHFVGDQPVVSFWGFRGVDGQGVDPLATAPRRAPAAAAVASASEAAPAAGVGVPLQPASRPWWRRWLWALLALLLLLLLLFLLAWCAGDREPLTGALPPGSTPPATDQTPPDQGGFLDRTLRYLGLEDRVPDGSTLGRSLPGDTVVPGGEVKTLPDGTVPIPPGNANPDGSKPEDIKPGDTGSPPQPPATPAEPPADPQAKPDQPKAPDPSADQPKSDQPRSDQPPGQPPSPPPPDAGAKGQPLQIPPDAAGKSGDLGFVGGEWRSDSGLVDQATKQPLQQVYRFDDKGKGEVVIRRADGVECRAPAQATMQGGRLGIEESGQPTCPDGRTFSPSKTECTRTPSGQTVCQGRNADGSTYRVGIERAAPKP